MPIGFTPNTMTAGDFTGHHRNDVLVAGGTTIKVLPSNGNGTFGTAVTTTTSVPVGDVAAGDLNGDGKLDLAIVNGGTSMYVLLGNGDGSFQTAVAYSAALFGGSPATLETVTVGALRPGAKPDIAVGEAGTPCCAPVGMEVYLNNGDGTFGTPTAYGAGNTYTDTHGIAIGDLTGDGVPDIVLNQTDSFNNGFVTVFVNGGSGTFTKGNTYNPEPGAHAVRIADLNGDGKNDIVDYAVGEPFYDGTQPAANVLLSAGGGNFATPVRYGTQSNSASAHPGATPHSMTLADLNGNGRPDVITANDDNNNNTTVAVLTNNGDGTYQAEQEFTVDAGPIAVSAVDLNGDGWPDIVTANTVNNDISVLINAGPVSPPTPSLTTAGGFPNSYHTTCSCGAPVNTATGEFWHNFNDLAVPGRGMALNFNRTYSASLVAQDGPLGHGWTDSYQMTLITDPNTGNITVTASNGSVVTFTLNGSVYQPPSYVLASLIKNQDSTFTYKGNDQTTSVFSAAGQLLKEVDRNGYATTLTYTGSVLSKVADPAARSLTFAYGSDGRISSVTDPDSRKVSFSYDASGNLITATDVNGGKWQFSYDANHLMLTMTDPRNGVLTNVYDTSSRVISQTDAMNRKTIFAYAPGQNGAEATTLTDAKGNQTLYQYQNLELTAVTRGYGTPQAAITSYTYDPLTHGVTTLTDSNGHVTTSTYDSSGNLLTVTDALGHKTTNTYDSLNDRLTSQDPMGVTTTMRYDAAGNLLTVSRPLTGTAKVQIITYRYTDASHPGEVTGIVDPNGKTTTLAYDSYGDVVTVVDPLGNKATATYNTIGWKLTSVSPKGNVSGCGCSAQYTTSYGHDPDGLVTTITDPLGHQTINHYDPDRNLDSFTDADGKKTTYTYDADNELTVMTRADTTTVKTDYNPDGTVLDQIDGKGQATTYKYDPLARAISVSDPLGGATTFSYDAAGNRLTLTDPQSQVTTFAYDADNELTSITYSDGKTANITGITYDADGHRTAMTDGTGTSTWTWDSLNRLTKSKNGAGKTVAYGYDLKDQLTTLTYPTGKMVTRGYDDAGHLTSVSDWLNHTTTFGYDPNSNLVTETLPTTGIVDTSTFDNADRLMGISDAKSSTVFASFTYGRDNNGQLTSDTETGMPGQPQAYAYNALNQLSGDNTKTYTYDAADNLTRLLNGSTLTYNVANELITLTKGNSTTTYGYDLRGNRTLVTKSGSLTTTLGYDQANRLTAYGTSSTYQYDGTGLRTSKRVGTSTSPFVWDLAQGLPLLLTGGGDSYVYGPGGLPLEQVNGSTVYWLHHDQVGSTRVLTDSTGKVLSTYTYEPYGNVTAKVGTIGTVFKYAGQYQDQESGMYYLRARYYDPTTAQFTSRDPVVAKTRSPYGYVAGNPLNATDPAGLDGVCDNGNWKTGVGHSACNGVLNCPDRATCLVVRQAIAYVYALTLEMLNTAQNQHCANAVAYLTQQKFELGVAADALANNKLNDPNFDAAGHSISVWKNKGVQRACLVAEVAALAPAIWFTGPLAVVAGVDGTALGLAEAFDHGPCSGPIEGS